MKINNNKSIESFLVMVLMVVFAAATAFIIIEGKLAFERVTDNKLQDENARIALSYVNKRIRQNDVSGKIIIDSDGVEGIEALRIGYEEEDLYSYIFAYEGMMYECYTDVTPTLALSTPVIAVDNLNFRANGKQIIMSIDYEYHGEDIKLEQTMGIRSEGGDSDE